MNLTILGTGNATVTHCYNTCFVLDGGGQYLLVDGDGGICGPSSSRINTWTIFWASSGSCA